MLQALWTLPVKCETHTLYITSLTCKATNNLLLKSWPFTVTFKVLQFASTNVTLNIQHFPRKSCMCNQVQAEPLSSDQTQINRSWTPAKTNRILEKVVHLYCCYLGNLLSEVKLGCIQGSIYWENSCSTE